MKFPALFLILALGSLAGSAEAKIAIPERERAGLYLAAIRHVAESHVTRRSQVFVVPEALLRHLSKSPIVGFSIRGDAPPFAFPSQKSSDTGILFLRVTLGEASLDDPQLEATFWFFIGPENAAAWRMEFRRTGDRWKLTSAKITARA